MIDQGEVVKVPLTLERAQEFAGMTPMPGERQQKQQRVQFLTQLVKDKAFYGARWAYATCKADGKRYRLDGQHSSWALTHLPEGVEFPVGKYVTIEEFLIDSLADDAAPIFDLFNNPRSSRSNEDMIGIYLSHSAKLRALDMARRLAVHITNGIAEHQSKVSHGVVLQPRRRGLYFEESKFPDFTDFTVWAYTFAAMKNGSFLSKPGIVAEMLDNWRREPVKADAFWSHVMRENHPDPDHETRTLAEQFREFTRSQKHYEAEDYRKKARRAWRTFEVDEETPEQRPLPPMDQPPTDGTDNRPSL